ncbi:MAG: hypothetical protein ABIZ52_08215 [Candidatus Limnocylindrales bacterium]
MIRPTDPAFETARLVDNGAIDRHPALIVQARDTADVIAAVEYARSSGLPLAVRSGERGRSLHRRRGPRARPA